MEKKPVPTPRSNKQNLNQDNKGQVKDITGPFFTHKYNLGSSPPIDLIFLSFVYSAFLTLYTIL
jgi:hypothetical protein